MRPLVTVEEVAGRLSEMRLCDIRWSLTDPNHGRDSYRAGHLPDAVFVDLDRDLAAPPGPGRHPLPTVEKFAENLGRLGIAPDSHVVVYDDVGGTVAARMWWMLTSVDHQAVQLLDGGYPAWVEAGQPTETGDVTVQPVLYPTPSGFQGVVGLEEIGGRMLIDARAPERYRGEIEPVDPVAGHIPGAINRPTADSLDPEGRFREPERLAEMYRAVPDDAVVYCGSGVNACHAALAMTLAGRPTPDVYVGSYSEWSRLGRPVAVGPTP